MYGPKSENRLFRDEIEKSFEALFELKTLDTYYCINCMFAYGCLRACQQRSN